MSVGKGRLPDQGARSERDRGGSQDGVTDGGDVEPRKRSFGSSSTDRRTDGFHRQDLDNSIPRWERQWRTLTVMQGRPTGGGGDLSCTTAPGPTCIGPLSPARERPFPLQRSQPSFERDGRIAFAERHISWHTVVHAREESTKPRSAPFQGRNALSGGSSTGTAPPGTAASTFMDHLAVCSDRPAAEWDAEAAALWCSTDGRVARATWHGRSSVGVHVAHPKGTNLATPDEERMLSWEGYRVPGRHPLRDPSTSVSTARGSSHDHGPSFLRS